MIPFVVDVPGLARQQRRRGDLRELGGSASGDDGQRNRADHARLRIYSLRNDDSSVANPQRTSSRPARVAKSVNAEDLKSSGPKGSCRFESGPGHHLAVASKWRPAGCCEGGGAEVGTLAGSHSIRINQQWRIVFRWSNGAHDVRIVDYH
jgi:hypothetical protein